MAKSKGKARELVALLSTGKRENGKPTKHIYTAKIRKGGADTKKLELMKFDPIARAHVLYKQTKLK